MKTDLFMDASGGISDSRLAAALVGLGLDEKGLTAVIRKSAELLGLGMVDVHTHVGFLEEDTLGRQLHLTCLEHKEAIPWAALTGNLGEVLREIGVSGPYAEFVHRAAAEVGMVQAIMGPQSEQTGEHSFPVMKIGTAHTPYQDAAPRQPKADDGDDSEFYIELEPEFVGGIKGLETFSHIFIFSYLNRSQNYSITLHPSWKEGHEQYGVFATRTPNRPSPIGLTRVRLWRIEGNRIYTGPLDLYDGTPVVDIKPFFRSLDAGEDEAAGNDGWLEGSDHLEQHRLGIPHTHPEAAGNAFEPQTFLLTLLGIAWGLQQLGVDLGTVQCAAPLHKGPDALSGEVLLAAFSPSFVPADQISSGGKTAWGLGAAGAHHALRLVLK